jgi:hypothetical protein
MTGVRQSGQKRAHRAMSDTDAALAAWGLNQLAAVQGGSMTTSRQTQDLNHPAIRELVNAANALPLGDRLTLLKALIPEIAREMTPREFEAAMLDLRLKGERFYDAVSHPGAGRVARNVLGERDYEGR